MSWPDLQFPPINLWTVWPRYDQWWKMTDEDWWYL